MANTVVTSDIDVFLTDAALAICSTYYIVLQASPGAVIFGQDMLFDIPFLADWKKLENTSSTVQTLTQLVKIAHVVIGTTKLVIKYFLEKMASSANQGVGMKVILGLSHQFIQMGQSGFNMEQSQNDWTFRELYLFQQSDLTVIHDIFNGLSPSPTQNLHFTYIMIFNHDTMCRLDKFFTSQSFFPLSHTDYPCGGKCHRPRICLHL